MKEYKKKILAFFILTTLILIFETNICFSSEGKNKTNTQVNSVITQITKQLNEQVEEIRKTIESSIILVIPQADDIVYMVPGDEWNWEEEELYSREYKTSLDNIEARLKQIGDKGKVPYLYSVILYPKKDIKYDYLFKVTERYEDAVGAIYSTENKDVWYRLGGPLQTSPPKR